ncbi:MAG: hypothetical protein ABI167_11910 [Nitrosospira sp.]
MMTRQVARQYCRGREVHSWIYGAAQAANSGENGRKLTASTR